MRRRFGRLRVIAVLAIVLIVAVAGLSSVRDLSMGSTSDRDVSGVTAGTSLDRDAYPSGTSNVAAAKSIGSVADTLVLSNNTLLAGNFLAESGGTPVSVAYDAAEESLDVVNAVSGTVSVVNVVSREITHIVPVGLVPQNATFAPPVGTLYVSIDPLSLTLTGEVVAVNTTYDTVVATIPMPAYNLPYGMAYDTKNRDLYVDVANYSLTETGYALVVISTSSNRIVDDIPSAGGLYGGVAYDPTNHDLYALNETYGRLEVVSGTTNKVLASPSLPCAAEDGGGAIGYDPANHDIYATSGQDNDVCVYSGSNNTLVATVPLTPGPVGGDSSSLQAIAVDAKADDVFLPSIATGFVTELSGSSNTVVGQVPDGFQPAGVLYDAHNGRLYVANEGSSNLTVWSPLKDSVVDSITLGIVPGWASVDSASGAIFLSAAAPGNLDVVNGTTNSLQRNLTVPEESIASAYDPAKGKIYALEENPASLAGTLVSVNASTFAVGSGAALGSVPEAVTFDAANGKLYSTNFLSNNISVVSGSTGKTTGSISLPSDDDIFPVGIAYDSKDQDVFAAVYTNGEAVYRIDGTNDSITGVAPLNFFPEPGLITVDPSNGNLYISGEGAGASAFTSGTIGVVGAKNLTQFATITSGADPIGGTYDPANGYVYFANALSDNLTVLNPATNKVVGSIVVGSLPTDVVYDPVSEELYVLNEGSGTVSIISTQTVVTGQP